MLEEWRSRWEDRIKLTCRASEAGIVKWIQKHQPSREETIYYDWHAKDGFVAYIKKKEEENT